MENDLSRIAFEAHQVAKDHGFWEGEVDVNFILAKLSLVHSEVSEVLEAVRKGKGERAIVEELNDIIIRTIDLWAGLWEEGLVESDLSEIYDEKMRFNSSRPYKHNNLA